jgi:VRR-NUC domain
MSNHFINPLLPKQSEDDLQIGCVQWFDYQYPHFSRLLFHIPNGGKRAKTEVRDRYGRVKSVPVEAARLKRMGTRRGVCDLFFSVSCGVYHGLYIEMKTLEGKTSKEQREFMMLAGAQGYRVEVCRTLEQFQKIIKEYLALGSVRPPSSVTTKNKWQS